MASPPSFHHLIPLTTLLLVFILPLSTAQAQRNISRGSFLTPLGQTRAWLSPSRDFAFGFRPLESNSTLFLLAIWYDQTVNKTIVWYANGNNPVQAGSRVDLTSDGQLSLKNHASNEVWNASVTGASYAAMLDTGNFVLASTNGTTLWQSFGAPTDTILPSQVMGLNTQLLSRLMDTDYSDGRFAFRMQLDGNLVGYAMSTSGYQYDPYWASSTVGNGTQLVFSESGSIYLTMRIGNSFDVLSTGRTSMEDAYLRATLDPDGVFRLYSYTKGGASWAVLAGVPSDICHAVVSSTGTGSGVCGFNSYCKSGDVSQRADCECPPHYSFLDPSRKYKGCKQDFSQSCDLDGSDFQMILMINVNWPFSDYEIFSSIDEDHCSKECLTDCFCAAVIYNSDRNCWKKKFPLSYGMMVFSDPLTKAFIKASKSNISFPQPSYSTSEKKDRKTWKLVRSLLVGSSVFLNILFIAVIVIVSFCSYSKRTKKLQPISSVSRLNLRAFTYKELEEATNGFSEEVGRGAFGIVYKGFLESDRRICIAVKKLDKLFQETEKEFMNEVKSIGQTHHKNLVKLLGYCDEGVERLLVYEFMRNGSLTSYLFGNIRPSWNQRTQIALGIARGLMYLHEECSSQIIHCDIKPQNILLDENFVARISDFGLAKLIRTDQTRTNTGIRGTRGYVAPEWFKNVGITAKVDVYSFGVMLLEIICCRKNVEKELENEEIILTYWAYDCYKYGRLDLLVKNDDEARVDMRRVERFLMVAIWCIQEDPSMRPSMQKAFQMLEESVLIPVPPDPSGNVSSIFIQ